MPRYELEITWDGDKLSGELASRDRGVVRRFEGVLELIRLLEPVPAPAAEGGSR